MSSGNVFNIADYRDMELIRACRAIASDAESGAIKGIIVLVFDDAGGAELAVAGRCMHDTDIALEQTAHFLSLVREQSRRS